LTIQEDHSTHANRTTVICQLQEDLVLKQLVQDIDGLLHNGTAMYGLAAGGFCAFVGLYYLGEYLFGDIDPEIDSRLDSTDGHNSRR
jgi:hypothetical protein